MEHLDATSRATATGAPAAPTEPVNSAATASRAAPGHGQAMAGSVRVVLDRAWDFREWRQAARRLLERDVEPARVEWHDAQASQAAISCTDVAVLRDDSEAVPDAGPAPIDAGGTPWPLEFMTIARRVLCHRDAGRHALLYRLAWRLRREPRLLDLAADADVARLQAMDREVRRAAHKMKAFVRFRRRPDAEVYVAWFDPGHPLLHALARFFVGRFASMRWVIVTPDASASWDGERLAFGPGSPRPAHPHADPCEDLWLTYYASIFNPARLKLRAMQREMPRRYWRDLPEAVLIPALTAGAARRTAAMLQADASQELRDAAARCGSLESLAAAVRACRACPLGCHGTPAVPGAGPSGARVMLVGGQPDDADERAGQPFAGAVGAVLQQSLAAAGIRRDDVYATHAVKHLAWQERRGRRLPSTADRRSLEHCAGWLQRERALVEPAVIVALGPTAARALLGHEAGGAAAAKPPSTNAHETPAGTVIATLDPAQVLREADPAARRAAQSTLVAALRLAGGAR
jgi:DNA polymerase